MIPALNYLLHDHTPNPDAHGRQEQTYIFLGLAHHRVSRVMSVLVRVDGMVHSNTRYY